MRYTGARLFARSKSVVRLFANAVTTVTPGEPMRAVPAMFQGFHAAGDGDGAPLPGPAFILPDSGPRDLSVGPSPGAVFVRPPSNACAVFDGVRQVAPLPPDGVRVRPYEGRTIDVSDIAATDYTSHGDFPVRYSDRRSDVFNRVIAPAGPGHPSPELVDIMSYCQTAESQKWISVRHCNSWGDFPPGGIPGGSIGAGPPSPQTQTLHVTAEIRSDGTGQILDVSPGSTGESVNADSSSPFKIVVRNHYKKVISITDMAVGGTHGEPDGMPLRIVSGEVPAVEDAAIVQLASKQGVLGAGVRSLHAPSVKLLSQLPAVVPSQGTVSLRWKAADADQNTLSASVEYSANGGKTYRMLTTGFSGDAFTIDASALERSADALLRVTGSDGFNVTSVQTPPFQTSGSAPAVTILNPRQKQAAFAGTTLFASGQAYDDAGNYLSGKALQWLDGKRVIGVGVVCCRHDDSCWRGSPDRHRRYSAPFRMRPGSVLCWEAGSTDRAVAPLLSSADHDLLFGTAYGAASGGTGEGAGGPHPLVRRTPFGALSPDSLRLAQ